MTRQRGIFGLGLLVSLAIYAAIAAAALTAVYAFDKSRQNIGAEKVRGEVAPITDACKMFGARTSPTDCAGHMRTAVADRDTALAGNVTLQADLKRLAIERQACSDEVTRLEQRGARAAAAAATRKPADDKRLAAIAPEREELVTVWGRPKPAMSCEQELAARDAMLKTTAEQRVRDFPNVPGAPPKPSGGLTIGEPPAPAKPPTPDRPAPTNPLRPKP